MIVIGLLAAGAWLVSARKDPKFRDQLREVGKASWVALRAVALALIAIAALIYTLIEAVAN